MPSPGQITEKETWHQAEVVLHLNRLSLAPRTPTPPGMTVRLGAPVVALAGTSKKINQKGDD